MERRSTSWVAQQCVQGGENGERVTLRVCRKILFMNKKLRRRPHLLLENKSRPPSESKQRLFSSPASQSLTCPTQSNPNARPLDRPFYRYRCPINRVSVPSIACLSSTRRPCGTHTAKTPRPKRQHPSVRNGKTLKLRSDFQAREEAVGRDVVYGCKRQSGSTPTPSHPCKRGTMREENAAYHRLNEIVASLAADPAPPPVRHAHAVGSNGASPSAWNVVVHGVPVHVPPNAVVCLGKGPGVRGTC